jgi:hypothetical protein
MEQFVRTARAGDVMPIPVESLFDTSLTTLAAGESIRSGECIALSDLWQEIAQ